LNSRTCPANEFRKRVWVSASRPYTVRKSADITVWPSFSNALAKSSAIYGAASPGLMAVTMRYLEGEEVMERMKTFLWPQISQILKMIITDLFLLNPTAEAVGFSCFFVPFVDQFFALRFFLSFFFLRFAR
jgi:hypothetical protein